MIEYSMSIQWVLNEYVSDTFIEYSLDIHWAFNEYSLSISLFNEHSMNIHWILNEYSVCSMSIQWMFNEHSMNIQWVFIEGVVKLTWAKRCLLAIFV